MSAERAPLHLLPPSAPEASPGALRPAAASPIPVAGERLASPGDAGQPSRGARPLAPRTRRAFLAGWLIGCAAIDLAVVFRLTTHNGSLVVMALVAALVMGPSGIGLGCVALVDRSRASLQALLVSAVSLGLAIALVPTARWISSETYFAAHQAELDALAVELRAAYRREGSAPDAAEVATRVMDPVRSRLSAVGVARVSRTDGGLLFATWPGGETWLYADGGTGEPQCARPRLRALGGRWFLLRCSEGWID